MALIVTDSLVAIAKTESTGRLVALMVGASHDSVRKLMSRSVRRTG